jgi:hypothetical protein
MAVVIIGRMIMVVVMGFITKATKLEQKWAIWISQTVIKRRTTEPSLQYFPPTLARVLLP